MPADAAVVLPAGARDHYLARAGEDPRAHRARRARRGHRRCGRAWPWTWTRTLLGEEAVAAGCRGRRGLPAALLALARDRLDAGETDDVAELTPAYVALPRGVKRAAEDLGWSPDLR